MPKYQHLYIYFMGSGNNPLRLAVLFEDATKLMRLYESVDGTHMFRVHKIPCIIYGIETCARVNLVHVCAMILEPTEYILDDEGDLIVLQKE